jgi:hypothetical protein
MDFFIEAEFSDSTQIIFVSGYNSLKTEDTQAASHHHQIGKNT